MNPKTGDEERNQSAPFNFAIATLMRINDILKDIKEVDKKTGIISKQLPIGDRLPEGLAQFIKLGLVQQLYTQSTPLLKEEAKKEIEEELKKLTPKTEKLSEDDSISYQYSFGANVKLNKVIIFIQKRLQEKGNFFMPSKKDPRFALDG